MNFLTKYFLKYRIPFFGAILCLSAEAFCDLLQPTIMSKIIDNGVATKNLHFVLSMGLVMLGVTGLGALAAIGRNMLASNVSMKFGTDLRSDMFKKIQSFTFESIDKFQTASLVTRLTNDVTQIQNLANGLMRIFVKAPLVCIGGIIMASLLDLHMATVLFITVPIISIFIIINIKIGYPTFQVLQKSLDKVNSVMREFLTAFRVVKAFNRSDFECERFGFANSELTDNSTRAMRIMSYFSPVVTLTINLGIVLVLWLGGHLVNDGNIQTGKVIAFINYMTQILGSLMFISFVFNMFVRAKASAERVGEVLNQENSMVFLEKSTNINEENNDIEFKNVYFSYDKGSNHNETKDLSVLKNLNFKIKTGDTIGIIGPTGSGKSSLINLIPRFYDLVEGSIEIGGIDIKTLDIEKLRDQIALVPQKSTLFTGTILENILWGKENADISEVKIASEIAQADHFIKGFPEGYETMLGQGGVTLSGGQKQRISIARALLKKPSILILDDCTSAVDIRTEAEIRKNIKSYSKNLTCIIIAQRITSVMSADKILVIENGDLKGIGSHKELMETCNLYRDIYRSQIGKEDLANVI